MIAVLVMAIGLLGFALLQTMSVRFTQSANQRTKATNLAYDILDQMRSNRLFAAQYTGASFDEDAAIPPNCIQQNVGDISVAINGTIWRCRVRQALGDGSSGVVAYNSGVATVTIRWNDQRWVDDDAQKTGNKETGVVTLSTRL
ncbi:type IV pilus modification protein PilV [Pseudoxanthomonas wuyuanensis]